MDEPQNDKTVSDQRRSHTNCLRKQTQQRSQRFSSCGY